jgi:D-alanyl-D-alanine dipeptidase
MHREMLFRALFLPTLALLALLACCTTSSRSSMPRGATYFVDGPQPVAIPPAVTKLEPHRVIQLAAAHNLVDVSKAVPGISIDLRYATAENVARRPLYSPRMPCLLRRETAQKLRVAHESLRAEGYGIRVWDAYRPPEVQEALAEAGEATDLFVSPEIGWSRHCAGVAVDVTLVDAQGLPQAMPTAFDTDSPLASADYRGSDPQIAQNVRRLHAAMRAAGFKPASSEWWHFDDEAFIHHPQPVLTSRQLGLPPLNP